MSDNERDFKGVWIPKTIWLDSRLRAIEKLYLAVQSVPEFQNMNYKETAEFLNISKSTLSKVVNELKKKGYIQICSTPEEIKNFVLENKNKGDKCEWCGNRSCVLHGHHYPIPKKDGGTEIVWICSNCHSEYHYIESVRGNVNGGLLENENKQSKQG